MERLLTGMLHQFCFGFRFVRNQVRLNVSWTRCEARYGMGRGEVNDL